MLIPVEQICKNLGLTLDLLGEIVRANGIKSAYVLDEAGDRIYGKYFDLEGYNRIAKAWANMEWHRLANAHTSLLTKWHPYSGMPRSKWTGDKP